MKIRPLKSSLEALRCRPAMYLGCLGKCGIETVKNGLRSFIQHPFFESHKFEEFEENGTFIFRNDGIGFEVEDHPTAKMSKLELTCTQMGLGALSDSFPSWNILTIANAFAEDFKITTCTNGRKYSLEFHRREKIALTDLGETKDTGSEICWKPDQGLFFDEKPEILYADEEIEF